MTPISAVRFQPMPQAYRAMQAKTSPRFASAEPAENPLKSTMDMYEFVDLAVKTPALLRTHRQYVADALNVVDIGDVMKHNRKTVAMQFLQLRKALQLTARRATPANIIVTVDLPKQDTEDLNRIITTALHTYSQTDAGALYRVVAGTSGPWANDTGKALSDVFNQHLISPLHLMPLDRQKHFLQLARQASPGHPVLETLTPQSLTSPLIQPFNAHLDTIRQGEPDGLIGLLPHLAVSRFVYPSVDDTATNTVELPLRTMTLISRHDGMQARYELGVPDAKCSPQSIQNTPVIDIMLETQQSQNTQWITMVTQPTLLAMQARPWYKAFMARSVQAASV